MLFASAATGGGIILAYAAKPAEVLGSATFTFARAVTYEIMNLYAVKMAAVFMISTSTLAIRTGIIARWIAFLGYAFALFLLLSGRYPGASVVHVPFGCEKQNSRSFLANQHLGKFRNNFADARLFILNDSQASLPWSAIIFYSGCDAAV
jgi:hypothetical protein